ncbi:MAG: hypothetical protein J0H69_19750 [Burkholderiales bacterium]|nr:hypothetical protein [Burkholderiales bacterium]
MAEPTVINCATQACTVTVVHELSLPPLQLTPGEAGAIAGAILLVWGVAFGFRMLIRTLHVDDKGQVDDSRE